MSLNWRQLQLFDVVPIRDPNLNTDDVLYSNGTLSAIASSANYMVLAVNSCCIKVIDTQFRCLRTFMAYDLDYRVSFVRSLPKSDLVVTIAEKQGLPSVLKLWDLNKLVQLEGLDELEETWKRKYQTQVLVQCGDNSFPISCFTFNVDFTCIAVGYTNGKVLLIRGDLIRDRGSKQRLIYESPDPVTGLHFNEFHELLYVTTTSRILTVPTTGRNQGKPLKILSKKTGVSLQCTDVEPETQELIVGTDTSVRYYNQISKSHTINFEVRKKLIYRYSKHYLLVVSPSEEINESSKKLITKVLIIDLNNKHISFSLTIPNTTINYAFELWSDLYLLSSDGILYKLHEKPINQQVELVLQRDLFSLAFSLAKQSHVPVQTLLKISKLHADYMYQKQDFDESIGLFIKCLKYYTNESLVLSENDESVNDFIMHIITKFKDAANIGNLTEFLYQLYRLKVANNDHITLLLCCYCKLKHVDKIRSFIDGLNLSSEQDINVQDSSNKRESTDFSDLDFPLIINLFKECGYFNEVIKLLYKLNQPNLIVDIQLNDLRRPKNCLRYIKTLSIDDLLIILIEHSKTLLDNLPIETTELLINVFTGKYVPNDRSNALAPTQAQNNGEENGEEDHGMMFPLNNYKSFMAYLSGKDEDEGDGDDSTLASKHLEPTYLPPRPSLIFASFINNPNEFVIFLEACIETFDKYQGNINDKLELLITLYEMYLSLSKKLVESQDEWLGKAKALIDQYSELLDKSQLLLISHIYDFKEGELISEKQSGYEESIFRSAQLNGDINRCFEIVKAHGDDKPELYKLLLRFVISKEEIFAKGDDKQFKFIINKLKDLKLASPLELIQILSTTEFTTIGLIRDYLIDIIDTSNQEINNNEKLVEFYEKESIKNSHKITELKTKPFIMQNNKCTACNLKLDFPVIHFKCKHSFHQRCLNDNYLSSSDALNSTPICSVCINDIDLVQTLRDDQLKSKDDLELFELQLQEAPDKFKVISNYLGKGIMENGFHQLTNDT